MLCVLVFSNQYRLEPREAVMKESALTAIDLRTYQLTCRDGYEIKLFVFILKAALTNVFIVTIDCTNMLNGAENQSSIPLRYRLK